MAEFSIENFRAQCEGMYTGLEKEFEAAVFVFEEARAKAEFVLTNLNALGGMLGKQPKRLPGPAPATSTVEVTGKVEVLVPQPETAPAQPKIRTLAQMQRKPRPDLRAGNENRSPNTLKNLETEALE
jgi:hypothetical protein